MAIPKQQHWVPRFYLRFFATPETAEKDDPKVWLLSKDEGDPLLTNVKNVANSHYLYSPKDEKGQRCGELESRFADLEGLMTSIWPLLANGFVDLHEDQSIRKGLALFVSLLYLRHPLRRTQVEKLHSHMVTLFESLPKDINGNPAVGEVKHKGVIREFDASGWTQYKSSGPEKKKELFVDSIKQNATYLAEILLQKRWSVIFSERPVFITTDNPVVMLHATKQVFGFTTSGTVVSFPLSPTRVLMMDDRLDQPSGRYYPLAETGLGQANGIAWRNCERFMVSPRHPDEVCTEILADAQ